MTEEKIMFNLSEELFLLSIDDDEGVILGSAKKTLPYGMVGAILAELALSERINIDSGKLILVDTTLTGDPELDETMQLLGASKKPHKITYWIKELASQKIVKRIASRLVDKGVLRREEKHLLWVIPFEAFPTQDASAKYWIKQHLRDMVLGGAKPEANTIVLLSLLKACQLLNIIFTKDERKAATKKIAELVTGEGFGEAVAKSIKEIQTVMMSAILVATGG
jgi:golgi phosphoprotein 3